MPIQFEFFCAGAFDLGRLCFIGLLVANDEFLNVVFHEENASAVTKTNNLQLDLLVFDF